MILCNILLLFFMTSLSVMPSRFHECLRKSLVTIIAEAKGFVHTQLWRVDLPNEMSNNWRMSHFINSNCGNHRRLDASLWLFFHPLAASLSKLKIIFPVIWFHAGRKKFNDASGDSSDLSGCLHRLVNDAIHNRTLIHFQQTSHRASDCAETSIMDVKALSFNLLLVWQAKWDFHPRTFQIFCKHAESFLPRWAKNNTSM